MTSEGFDSTGALLEARNVVQTFVVRERLGRAGRRIPAVAGVSFSIRQGEILGLVGESGSGKSTLARALLQMPRPTSGSVLLRGIDLTGLRGRRLREERRQIQMVFQNPMGSVDPKWRIADIVEEPLTGLGTNTRATRRHRVAEVLDLVGLPVTLYGRKRPRELSGGQCQRVAIARALAPRPSLIIFDEALSSLDALTRAQFISVFELMKTGLRLSAFFISHDLAVVRQVCDRLIVMHRGRLCEVAASETLYRDARHPLTLALIASHPVSNSSAEPLNQLTTATAPDDLGGCSFRTRCPHSRDICGVAVPYLRQVGANHFVACHVDFSKSAS